MPYIDAESRARLADGSLAQTPGELNYVLTQVVLEYSIRMGSTYRAYNDCLGALEGAKLEFYRRLVTPYENRKITENGDVYR